MTFYYDCNFIIVHWWGKTNDYKIRTPYDFARTLVVNTIMHRHACALFDFGAFFVTVVVSIIVNVVLLRGKRFFLKWVKIRLFEIDKQVWHVSFTCHWTFSLVITTIPNVSTWYILTIHVLKACLSSPRNLFISLR